MAGRAQPKPADGLERIFDRALQRPEEIEPAFGEIGFRLLAVRSVRFRCGCSKDRMVDHILRFANVERDDLFDPGQWLSRHYRPGPIGALRMGLSHGAYCVGCCWMLMLLLFVVGVMNLAWIAALTLPVAAEKLLPRGEWIARIGGTAFILWGVVLLAAG